MRLAHVQVHAEFAVFSCYSPKILGPKKVIHSTPHAVSTDKVARINQLLLQWRRHRKLGFYAHRWNLPLETPCGGCDTVTTQQGWPQISPQLSDPAVYNIGTYAPQYHNHVVYMYAYPTDQANSYQSDTGKTFQAFRSKLHCRASLRFRVISFVASYKRSLKF